MCAAAHGLPGWAPATRTLSPTGASRLEVWREGPGGAPELLIIGDLYQLWMQSRNNRGASAPMPKVSWEAE